MYLHSEVTILNYIQLSSLWRLPSLCTKASSESLAAQFCLLSYFSAGCALLFRGRLEEKSTRAQNLVRHVEELDPLLLTSDLQGQKDERFRPPARLWTATRPAKSSSRQDRVQLGTKEGKVKKNEQLTCSTASSSATTADNSGMPADLSFRSDHRCALLIALTCASS